MYTGAVTVFDREHGQNCALVSKLTSHTFWLLFLGFFGVLFFFFFQYTTAALWYRNDIKIISTQHLQEITV